ncbi:hypothetical protein [Mycolicibacterium thermoresistibile]|uniref:Uncharacterized protein n=1 Tax=Mycolicibacterium thermoresistibile (strain ATCC 19527 / DSM 44167 / CIP 105390 / JCM 6362 / NCTC 10409 / 316) TaxID=1078020 RepID=G7CIK4_MYCT3|nr:hypothetical protein [Mycolicibacterium thermoresistibile]EHI11333.1 hypothetical protein KEK_10578 [Mycolicibacterium thermoresistibile ATCC 19527]MCV7190458.1 hypothetical protein [Mycolicibacterium thermoresistibile]SNW20819.1 Uncharacterised protein [Mycolicibacterium thermoresistibile]
MTTIGHDRASTGLEGGEAAVLRQLMAARRSCRAFIPPADPPASGQG